VGNIALWPCFVGAIFFCGWVDRGAEGIRCRAGPRQAGGAGARFRGGAAGGLRGGTPGLRTIRHGRGAGVDAGAIVGGVFCGRGADRGGAGADLEDTGAANGCAAGDCRYC